MSPPTKSPPPLQSTDLPADCSPAISPVNPISTNSSPPTRSPAALTALTTLTSFPSPSSLLSWLSSPQVQGPYADLTTSYLSHHLDAPPPSYLAVLSAAGAASASSDSSSSSSNHLLADRPDRSAWDPNDHYARFVCLVHREACRDRFSEWPGVQEMHVAVWSWQLVNVLNYLVEWGTEGASLAPPTSDEGVESQPSEEDKEWITLSSAPVSPMASSFVMLDEDEDEDEGEEEEEEEEE